MVLGDVPRAADALLDVEPGRLLVVGYDVWSSRRARDRRGVGAVDRGGVVVTEPVCCGKDRSGVCDCTATVLPRSRRMSGGAIDLGGVTAASPVELSCCEYTLDGVAEEKGGTFMSDDVPD